MDAAAEVLGKVSIFGALAEETLEFLASRLEPVQVAAGEAFFTEGELGDAVYVLESGRAEVVKSRGDQSVVLAGLGPGACFGEVALVGICPRSASVRARTACRAVRLANRALHELYGRDLEQFTLIQMNLGREIARRLTRASELLLEHAAVEGDERAMADGVAGVVK